VWGTSTSCIFFSFSYKTNILALGAFSITRLSRLVTGRAFFLLFEFLRWLIQFTAPVSEAFTAARQALPNFFSGDYSFFSETDAWTPSAIRGETHFSRACNMNLILSLS